MKLTHRIATAAATGAMMLNMVSPVLAGTTITITNSSNGRDTRNTAVIDLTRVVTVVQSNVTDVENKIDQEATTGENSVRDTIGGDVEVKTGYVDQEVSVTTEAGANVATVEDCGCDLDVEVLNEKNGRDSNNQVDFALQELLNMFQANETKVETKVDQEAETGENEVRDTIDGDVDVETGNVYQDMVVATSAGYNEADMGGGQGTSSFDLVNSMNGVSSKNGIDTVIARLTMGVQNNAADVESKLDQEGETGENSLRDNLGGVHLETGYVDQEMFVSTLLGANMLAGGDCCGVDAELVNEKNARDSRSDIEVGLQELAEYFQDNSQKVENEADQEGETGENESRDNNADPIVTGSVDSSIELITSAGTNVVGSSDMVLDAEYISATLILLLMQLML